MRKLKQPQKETPVDHLRVELTLTEIALNVANASLRIANADNEYLAAENRVLRAELEVTELAARLKVLRLQSSVLGDDADGVNLVDQIKEAEQLKRKATRNLEKAEFALADVMRKQQGFEMEEN